MLIKMRILPTNVYYFNTNNSIYRIIQLCSKRWHSPTLRVRVTFKIEKEDYGILS